jgi:hypothetical protein
MHRLGRDQNLLHTADYSRLSAFKGWLCVERRSSRYARLSAPELDYVSDQLTVYGKSLPSLGKFPMAVHTVHQRGGELTGMLGGWPSADR